MSQRYTFTLTHEDGTIITLSGNKLASPDILQDYKDFLLGCGFSKETVDQINHEGGQYED